MRRSRDRRTPAQGSAAPMSKTVALACFFSLAATLVSHSDGQQMDPGVMQRQVQQQMGGSTCGGGGVPPPNRIVQLVSAVAASGATVAHSVREHPRATVAATVAVGTAVWAGKETRRSGLLVRRSPRVSLLRPSDAYLSWVLETAADAPIASPLRGVILSPLEDADAEEEQEEGSQQQADGAASARGTGKGRGGGRRRVGGGSRTSSSSSSSSPSLSGEETAGSVREVWEALHRGRAVAGEGTYTEEAWHGGKSGKGKKGAVKSVTSGLRVGRGLGLYHKFAQGLGNLDVFDGRSDCELMAAESSTEDVGSTLGLLTRSTMGTYSLSALRVILRRERSVPVPRVDDDGDDVDAGRLGGGGKRSRARSSGDSGSSGRRKGRRRSRRRSSTSAKKGKGVRKEEDNKSGEPSAVGAEAESHRQYTLALSAVEGAGWSGTWVFRVTYDAETDEVWFQTRLAQRKGALGTTAGGDQAGLVAKVNQDMLARANKHAAVLRTREEQFARVSSLAQSRARDAKELARDRILNPEKYKRVHRYMREDSHTTGGATARPARWGEERRRNDIRLK